MNFFSIKNLDKYQHYAERKPIWVKLYCSILSDPVFISLSDQAKLSYVLLLPLASVNDNKLPNDSKLLKRMLQLENSPKLQELADKGFIVGFEELQSASTEKLQDYIFLSLSNLVISFLNDKANKNFRETDGNRKEIIARAKEGFTEDDFKKVIVNRLAHWKNTDMEQYLRTSTLFRRRNFDGYLNSPMPSQIKETTRDKFATTKLDQARSTLENFITGGESGQDKIAFKANSEA